MSRIIVKNLPEKITENDLKQFFGSKGCITDVQLKYTKSGIFRHFAFVGFQNASEAEIATKYFDKTYIKSSKISVDLCQPLFQEKKNNGLSEKTLPTFSTVNAKNNKISDYENNNACAILQEKLEKDPDFSVFWETHQKHLHTSWSNNAISVLKQKQNMKSKEKKFSESENLKKDAFTAKSDKEYLELKMKNNFDSDKTIKEKKAKLSLQSQTKSLNLKHELITLKVSNLPHKIKKRDLRQFFKPLHITSLRFPPRMKGFAYIGVNSKKEAKHALSKHHSFINDHRVEVKILKCHNKMIRYSNEKCSKNCELEESVGESGRIFIRNLAYGVTENDLKYILEAFGPITELHLPIDKLTNHSKGFAFVTFMFPEQAIQAIDKLDGTILQGRILHLLPGIPKSVFDPLQLEGIPFKIRKRFEKKKEASLSHNWNSLFLNPNAVAEEVAHRYKRTKEEVLDSESGNVAVRLALGETQLVNELKEFFTEHDICLDVFHQSSAERSSTVILVKNLPAHTESQALSALFGKFGELGRVILPPFGSTAIVEFLEPTEARSAFQKLAYKNFKDVPLYLEWAPTRIFNSINKETDDKIIKENKDRNIQKKTTIYVKNLNFNTDEKSLNKHFESCGKVKNAIIAQKKDSKAPLKVSSLGYGFVEYNDENEAKNALRCLQHSYLEGHQLELKIAMHAPELPKYVKSKHNITINEDQENCKILVRNVPFEANHYELTALFQTFGPLRFVRMPKKLGGSHRGFAFVEFTTKENAKHAFESLGKSTHLYGRRLFLEWAQKEENIEKLRENTRRYFDIKNDNPQQPKADINVEEFIDTSDIKNKSFQ